MERIALVALLKPFILFLFLCLLVGAVMSVQRWMPEGRLKRLLLRRIF